MDVREIAYRRMAAHRLAGPPLPDPVAATGRLGAVQAQEYPYARWSLGRRTAGHGDADLRRLVDDGALVRTHALRPTWHFLAPEDLGWIQALTGPRVHAFNAYYYRQFGLTAASAERTTGLIVDALRGGRHLTRREIAEVLAAGGHPADGVKLAYVVMQAELDGLVVNGPMRGKQHTYALAAERVAAPRTLTGDDALAELTRRYFSSHGPAAVKDFAWWSSLTVAQIRRGLDLAGPALASAQVDGLTFWYDPDVPPADPGVPTAHLLQCYDEYVVAYTATKFATNLRGLVPDPDRYRRNLMVHPLMLDGQLAGFWRRRPEGGGLVLEVDLVADPTAHQRRALDDELSRHVAFAGVPIVVSYV